jgi:HTH-type transcriptional regulator / antitoxin HipB
MRVATVRELGAAVRQARRDRGQTQADFARMLGVYPDWVGRLERGNPRLEVQLVLDAVNAAGLSLTLGEQHSVGSPDSSSVLDDVLNELALGTTRADEANPAGGE